MLMYVNTTQKRIALQSQITSCHDHIHVMAKSVRKNVYLLKAIKNVNRLFLSSETKSVKKTSKSRCKNRHETEAKETNMEQDKECETPPMAMASVYEQEIERTETKTKTQSTAQRRAR